MYRIFVMVLSPEIFHCTVYTNFESNSVVFKELTSLQDVIMQKLFDIKKPAAYEGHMLPLDLCAFIYYFDELFKGLHTNYSTYYDTYEYFAERNGPLFLQKNVSEATLKKNFFYQQAQFEEMYDYIRQIGDMWTKIESVVKSRRKT